jgi:hypothetical protein
VTPEFRSHGDDVRAMNELAREAVHERIGEERVYATDFGERTFGIGDVLVGRERAHVNGDLYTLVGTSIAPSITATRRLRIDPKGGPLTPSLHSRQRRRLGAGCTSM